MSASPKGQRNKDLKRERQKLNASKAAAEQQKQEKPGEKWKKESVGEGKIHVPEQEAQKLASLEARVEGGSKFEFQFVVLLLS